MRTLIGSAAIKHWLPDFRREPKDRDYFETSAEPSHFHEKGEDVFWHPALALWDFGPIATLDELYTIKVSHAFWDLHGTWNKHMMDTMALKKAGAQFIPELYKILYKVWEDTHGKKRANLEADPDDFFNDRVIKRIFDHDSIHESVAYHDRPLFEAILRDDSAVAVDKSKWEALSHEDKLRMVREEVYATALERLVVPSDYTYSSGLAYQKILKSTITSLSKGWFPLYAVLHFDELTKADVDYVKRHKDNSHKLRPYVSNNK